MKEEVVKGRARIIVPDLCHPEGAKIPVFGTCAFDAIKLEDQLELWKQHLHLPEDHEVIGIFYDLWHIHWCILIESATIPPVPQDEYPPQYTATFNLSRDGTFALANIHKIDMNRE